MVLAAAALWGTTGAAQTFASGQLAASWFGALRLLVASAFFVIYVLVMRGLAPAAFHGPKHSRRLSPLALLGAGLCMAIYNLAFFAGIRGTGVAVGTAVALGSGPVWAGILQSVLARRIPAPVWWWGTALAVAGGVLMSVASGGPALQAAAAGGVGLLLCLLAGLSYAGYSLVNKQLLGAAAPGMITLYAFMVAAALALPAAWLDAGPLRLQASDIAPLLYVGLITAGVAYLLFGHALRHISAATGVTLALVEPVVAFVLAVFLLGEQPGWVAFSGLILVVAGLLIVVRAELR